MGLPSISLLCKRPVHSLIANVFTVAFGGTTDKGAVGLHFAF